MDPARVRNDQKPKDDASVNRYGVELLGFDYNEQAKYHWSGEGDCLRVFANSAVGKHITSIDVRGNTIDVHYDNREMKTFDTPNKYFMATAQVRIIGGNSSRKIKINVFSRNIGKKGVKAFQGQNLLISSDLPETLVDISQHGAGNILYIENRSTGKLVVSGFSSRQQRQIQLGKAQINPSEGEFRVEGDGGPEQPTNGSVDIMHANDTKNTLGIEAGGKINWDIFAPAKQAGRGR